MKTITLATFNSREQAEPLRHRLEEAHIPAWIRDSGILKFLWFVHRPRAEVRLEVPARDFQQSLRMLETMDLRHEKAADWAVHCPECHSAQVIYPQFTGKFFLPNLIGLLSALGLVKKEFYCEHCHYTWLPTEDISYKQRANMAPNYFLEDVPKLDSEQPSGKFHLTEWQEKKRSALDD
jgi:hypothetical protein